jgi:squalene-associated FAD-dependent desaturase
VILGGGLAGLAAGVRLSEAGFAVTLLEKRNVLGGRASSFRPPGETEPIDNCQHVLLGCCTNLIDFFDRTDTLDQIRFFRRFDFIGDAGTASLAASLLPAPLHFLPSVMRFHHLNSQDRQSLVRAILAIMRTPQPYPDVPFIDWLRKQRQSTEVINLFWRVIMTSALNEDPERLSARPAFHVIVDSFVRNRRGYRMGVPKVPLSQLYSPDKIGKWMSLRLGAVAASLEAEGGNVSGLVLQNGEKVDANYYLSALPPDALANLFQTEQRERWPELNEWKALEWSPITGIHLWYDRPVMKLPHAVVVGKTIQWIFNKSAVGAAATAGQYLQVVISASRALLTLKREEILDLIQRELAALLPETQSAKLERAVVVKEAESTPSFPPGYESRRPGPTTQFRNFFLAGDWTGTGWPPTMESAVRSGYHAAECIAQAAGLGKTFMVPDLPSDPLARILLA